MENFLQEEWNPEKREQLMMEVIPEQVSRREQIRKERSENPDKRDAYLKKCGEQADAIFKAIEQNRQLLSEENYLSIAETAEFLENESVGIEGVDF